MWFKITIIFFFCLMKKLLHPFTEPVGQSCRIVQSSHLPPLHSFQSCSLKFIFPTPGRNCQQLPKLFWFLSERITISLQHLKISSSLTVQFNLLYNLNYLSPAGACLSCASCKEQGERAWHLNSQHPPPHCCPFQSNVLQEERWQGKNSQTPPDWWS